MSRQTFSFPTDEILSVMTGRKLCGNYDGLIFLMDFLLGGELPKGKHAAALTKVAVLIAEQLDWVRGAEDSFRHFQGEPCDWLKIQIAEHGDSHRLSGPHDSETSKGTDPIDPLPSVNERNSVKEMTMEEGHQPYLDAAKKCQLDWSDVNNMNTDAWEAVEKLMRLSVGGEKSTVEMLRDLAVGITRHLLTYHADSMQFCHEFPIIVHAGTQKRKRQLELAESLPIGVKVGYPWKSLVGRPPEAGKNTPAGFWRGIQFWIDLVRAYIQEFPNYKCAILDNSPRASVALQGRMVGLAAFGEHGEEEWFCVARDFVVANPKSLIPDWIVTRANRGKTATGLASLWEGELRKGLGSCWSRKNPPKM